LIQPPKTLSALTAMFKWEALTDQERVGSGDGEKWE